MCGITQQRVGELLLRLEGGVGLGAVVGETVDAVAGCGQGRVGIAEEASLSCAWGCAMLAIYEGVLRPVYVHPGVEALG